MAENPVLYESLTVSELFNLVGNRGLDKAEMEEKVAPRSKSANSRQAMNGLDVRSAKIFRNLLFRFKEEVKSIVFSTHVMPFVEMLCDWVAIIYDGRIVAEGSVKALKEMTELRDLEDVFLKLTGGEDALRVASALL